MDIVNLLKTFLENCNYLFTLFIVFPAIIGVGLYLTLKLSWVQLSQFRNSFYSLIKNNDSHEGNISRFEAISAVLAGNFGTGNISGMAIAISTGGPGALVWMWVMAFFGAAIQYTSCVLGIAYRKKQKGNEYAGGPMYYLRDGLGYKKLASLFAIFTLFGAVSVGNFAQINSIILPLEQMGYNPLYCSLIIAAMTGLVILGGIKRLANFASFFVPFKALIYLLTALTIIVWNYEKLLPALNLMFHHAFDFSSLLGGAAGYGTLRAITTGFDRGLFATDAGTGTAPILQASARSEHPVADGISTLIAPLVVMIVCTATGLVLIMTGAWQEPGLQSTNMVTYAFSQGLGSPIGSTIVIVSLVLFAYTTILTWCYCGEKALEFLAGPDSIRWFRLIYVALVPVGVILNVSTIWALADLAITLMLFINLIGVTKLSSEVIHTSKEYHLQNQQAI